MTPARTVTPEGSLGGKSSSSQTLLRGLDVIEAVCDGAIGLAELASRLSLTRSTTHRLAAALVERRYLHYLPREGYVLGSKLLELGFEAQRQKDLPRVARPYLEALAAQTEDTIHLGILDKGRALYLDKVPGRRRASANASRCVQPVWARRFCWTRPKPGGPRCSMSRRRRAVACSTARHG